MDLRACNNLNVKSGWLHIFDTFLVMSIREALYFLLSWGAPLDLSFCAIVSSRTRTSHLPFFVQAGNLDV